MKAEWYIAERPGNFKELKQYPRKNKATIQFERLKARLHAKVEHPFRIVKARYKGLLKNDSQPAMLFVLANLARVDQLIRIQERST